MRSEWSLENPPAFPAKVIEAARESVALRLKIAGASIDPAVMSLAILEAALAIAQASKITLFSLRALHLIEYKCEYLVELRTKRARLSEVFKHV
jgi:hypothetical protein